MKSQMFVRFDVDDENETFGTFDHIGCLPTEFPFLHII